MQYELGIIGAGNMAEAIARGVTASGLMQPSQIIAADVSVDRQNLFTNQLGIRAVDDNIEVARRSKAILLSVKPQQMEGALRGIGAVMDESALVISIAAGITCRFIETAMGAGKAWRVVRTMPNTPMLVGQGMAAIARGTYATQADLAAANRIFATAATVIEVEESKLDAVTAVSGSGPAYFFFLAEQMMRAAMALGLTAEEARILTIKTAVGSAALMAGSNDSPEELRRKVTSPGGTTQAAIEHLQKQRAGEAMVEAIEAAAAKSRQLAK